MIAQWFNRSGIGQLVAPDSNVDTAFEDDESDNHFWNLLAPDPKFMPPTNVVSPGQPSCQDRKIFCTHCNIWITTNSIASEPDNTNNLSTPKRDKNTSPNDMVDLYDVNVRVLSACKDTSKFMRSPPLEKSMNEKFLRMCGSMTQMNEKIVKRFRNMITKKPDLLRVRATNLGETAPDGYTSLQVTAYANHTVAANIIFELEKEYRNTTGGNQYSELHLDRNMLGQTALHRASERGNLEMIQLLLPHYQFPGPALLLDLDRQTAFGRAMTSPNPKARSNLRKLESVLYTNNDLSICGNPKPKKERMSRVRSLGLEYGISEMPGRRGTMEDAMSVETWYDEVTDDKKFAGDNHNISLFTVCDGHGDNGVVSNFIASKVSSILKECKCDIDKTSNEGITPTNYWNKIWHRACLKLDDQLRNLDMISGGSTAVFALVTKHHIVVANVGDSRCILISEKDEKAMTDNNEANGAKEIENENNSNGDNIKKYTEENPDDTIPVEATGNESSEPPALIHETELSKPSLHGAKLTIATALSNDHKPNLPQECDRIRKSGFDVMDITFEENDKKVTIHKIVKNEKSQLAVSRAFGDFDYKVNTQLGVSEQSVIPIAEVHVHERNPKEDLYLILACDGIWDVMTNNEVKEFVEQKFATKSEEAVDTILPDVADGLLQQCLRQGSRDNMSCILIKFESGIHTTDQSSASGLPKVLDFGSP